MAEKYDILVVGAGPGGHAAAVRGAKLGARTAIIEKAGWGGTCTHRGCIPTKALLACSRRYAELKKLGRMGVKVADPSFDYAAMKRHQEQIVKISAMGVQKSLTESGVEMKSGEGRILSPNEVEWTAPDGRVERLSAKNLVIAWGSEPALPPGVHPSERILTSDGLLSLATLPGSLLIVGGSVIGVEFATLFAELGVRVTLLEMVEQLLPGEDAEAAGLLTQELKKLGIAINTGMRMESLREEGPGVRLTAVPAAPAAGPAGSAVAEPGLGLGASGSRAGGDAQISRSGPPGQGSPGVQQPGSGVENPPGIRPGGALDLSADYALICTGRKPRLHTEELNALGIGYDRRGITVDARQMTNVPGIFAIGDVTGGMMLAHRAMQQGKLLAGRLCGAAEIRFREEALPSVVYTHPQIARVGLTEEEARKRGIAVTVHRAEFAANITARTALLGAGFVKLLFDGERLAGATIVGDQAGELITPLGLAMAAGLGRRQLEEWIIPHPTLSEILAI